MYPTIQLDYTFSMGVVPNAILHYRPESSLTDCHADCPRVSQSRLAIAVVPYK